MIAQPAPELFPGAPPKVAGALPVMNAVTGLLEHANVAFSAGPLNYFFNTAELHRWHHSTDPVLSSRNFGKTLSHWDWVFGTAHSNTREELKEVGVKTENIPAGILDHVHFET
jgi:sterol desaturase/sphingolipid hydroxylase (fatty acid hydroxylase superfamily)